MTLTLEMIKGAIPALNKKEREELRALLDESGYVEWRKETAAFRKKVRLMVKDKRPASQIVSEGRR